MSSYQPQSVMPPEIQQIASIYQMGAIDFMLGSTSRRQLQFYHCRQGFIVKEGMNAAQPFRWDQIPVVWRNVKITHIYNRVTRVIAKITYIIQRVDGYTFYLDHALDNFDLMCKNIEAETRKILLPPAIQSYMYGQMLTFGPIVLNRQGISNGREWLPWYQIEAITNQVDYDNEIIKVKRMGSWLSWKKITTANIPNLSVLLALVDYALRECGRR